MFNPEIIKKPSIEGNKILKDGIGKYFKDILNKTPEKLLDTLNLSKEDLIKRIGSDLGKAVGNSIGIPGVGEITGELTEKGIEKIRGLIIDNKRNGMEREKTVFEELKAKYPDAVILKEVFLRDKEGNPVKDLETGEKRRIDFVVVQDGKIIDMVEVTSKTANKDAQIGKENRIREEGGNYIKDSNGNIIRIPNDVYTRIDRRDFK